MARSIRPLPRAYSARKSTQPTITTSRKVHARAAAPRTGSLRAKAGRALDDQQAAVVGAPDDERPGRAVPEAGQQEDDEQVAVGRGAAAPVAAERDVDVVAEPARERHVPAPPEVGDRLRAEYGPVEVLGKPEAEHPAEADRHVGVAGEVEVDLQRVGERAEPRRRRGQSGRASAKAGVGRAARACRRSAPSSQRPSAKRRTPSAKSSSWSRAGVGQLVGDLVVAHDRPGDRAAGTRDVGRRTVSGLLCGGRRRRGRRRRRRRCGGT